MSKLDLATAIASSTVAIALRGRDEYGRPLTGKRQHEMLAQAAAASPHVISAAIRQLEGQVALLRPYLAGENT